MMILMNSLTRMGADSTTAGAAIRVTVAFIVFFVTLAAVGLIIARVPTPDVLTILPRHVATLCGVAAVLAVSARAFDVSPAAYGLNMDRRWISDLLGGIAIGVLFHSDCDESVRGRPHDGGGSHR